MGHRWDILGTGQVGTRHGCARGRDLLTLNLTANELNDDLQARTTGLEKEEKKESEDVAPGKEQSNMIPTTDPVVLSTPAQLQFVPCSSNW